MPPASFAEALRDYARQLAAAPVPGLDAQPEDQLKRPVGTLLEAGGALVGQVVRASTEVRVAGLGGRPDFGVAVGGALAGHLELKAPGVGARAHRFTERRNREQWEKFKSLPNLVYTDGSEWALYRSGEPAGAVVRLSETPTAAEAGDLERLLRDFLGWEPLSPANPRALAELLAPLCRLVRDDVLAAVGEEGSSLALLAGELRQTLFPDADDARFADAYAQTLTYALLLARLEGAASVEPDAAAAALDAGHGLLAQVLRVLGQPAARLEVGVGLDLLVRTIGAVDPAALRKGGADPWLYFYEDFLAAYDRKLRNDYGVYYTPPAVILAQVRLVAEVLRVSFGKPLAYAEEGVTVLDPAAGTGAYPLAVLEHGLAAATGRYGPGAAAGHAKAIAERLNAFELLVGPYAVGHLRLTQKVLEAGGEPPPGGVHVYLTDTLENPGAEPPPINSLFTRKLTEEHARAQKVKAETRVLVCIGNPPYDRQQIETFDTGVERRGGWVRFGDPLALAASEPTRRRSGEGTRETRGILRDFTEPAIAAGQGGHLKNLYNDYVYFWRWALWKVFDTTGGRGVVCLITAASYLRGPGFVGMRERLRRTADEVYILDLEGDSLGARKTENVFNIRVPVAIALVVRYGEPKPEEPARVRYARLEGTRAAKLEQLQAIEGLSSLEWRDCPSDWQAPFLPVGEADYYGWPLLTDLFPWQHTGAEFKRTWPIGETAAVLEARWQSFVRATRAARADLFRETRDRKVDRQYLSLSGGPKEPPLASLPADTSSPHIARYGMRSFDRQLVLADMRLGDFIKPVLWRVYGPKQIFMTSNLVGVLGAGPAATITTDVPDRHYFCGRGGKDVIPLYRDVDGLEPNITAGLLETLGAAYGEPVSAEDFFAYAVALLSSRRYVEHFSEELTIPGPRLPVTKDAALFEEAVRLGRRLVNLHTRGERFPEGGGGVPPGAARNTVAVPGGQEGYPEQFAYNPATRTLRVGGGEFAPVPPEVWGFSVSGLEVVRSWLGYRMRERAGRRSSPLDELRPEGWGIELTTQLLELLWLLEATLALGPELDGVLEAVLGGETFEAADLPRPSSAERRPPGGEEEDGEAVQAGLGL